MTGWTWASARRRGTSHRKTGLPCQDALRCRIVGETLIGVVSDGAGSVSHGGTGAALVACLFAARAGAWIERGAGLPDDATVEGWIDEARAIITAAATRRGLAPRDFAATLVACIASPDETVLALVGDGAAVLRTDDGWIIPSWPESGEYASTTFFMTDQPAPRLRLLRTGPADAIAVLSDGLERLALDFAGEQPHAPFFDTMTRPIMASPGVGRHPGLSRSLSGWLDSDAVNARTDDDKSLILAVRR